MLLDGSWQPGDKLSLRVLDGYFSSEENKAEFIIRGKKKKTNPYAYDENANEAELSIIISKFPFFLILYFSCFPSSVSWVSFKRYSPLL